MDRVAQPHSSEARPAGVIDSVGNALELLRAFEHDSEIRVNQASRDLGLSRSTVHRLLTTLVFHGFVEQDMTTRSYRPGPALTGLGLAVVEKSDLRTVARSAMEKLARATQETVHLTVLQGEHVLCLDSIESTRSVRTGSRVGWSLPTHATAAGKALLAALSDSEVAAIFPSDLIESSGAIATVRRIDLMAELEFIRARGYSTNLGQSEPDVSAIGVALRDRQGRARAALSVTAPRTRGDETWMREAGPRAAAIAEEFRGTVS